jgi:hypothetical protein
MPEGNYFIEFNVVFIPIIMIRQEMENVLWKESLNSDGQQFKKYQQSEHSPLTEYSMYIISFA